MHICVDERETALYASLTDLVAFHRQSGKGAAIEITKKVLTLGDIVLEYPDGRTAIIIERKTLLDLLSSIRDSRYDEQSYRLIHSSGIPRHHIVYLIEGVMSQLNQQKDRDLVYSAMFSLNHYKGFSTFRTSSVLETAQWIWAVAMKIHRNEAQKKRPYLGAAAAAEPPPSSLSEDPLAPVSVPPLTPPPPPYCSVVKKVKKDNVTPDNWGEIVLCQIPGISTVSAVAILRQYKTLSRLTAALQTDPHCLDHITTTSSAGTRKLSSGVIASLRRFLVAIDDVPETEPSTINV